MTIDPLEPEVRRRGLVVVAMGGHAFIRRGEAGTLEDHLRNAGAICDRLMALVERGYDLVVTHGNGPQVGHLLIQNELTEDEVPAWPLDVLVAETAGSLGYVLQQSLQNRLRGLTERRYVVTFICQTVVDADDPAFAAPSKPIGPFFSEALAKERRETLGWEITQDPKRGWRRVVPSPEPKRVVQWRTIRDAAQRGHIVVACGGGGVPVVRDAEGDFVGVEAVIDKDLTSCVLARQIGAELLIVLSDVENVYLHWGTDRQRALNALTIEEVERYIAEGHFPPGSMGPKVTAMLRFLKAGGRRGLITSPELLPEALEGRAGTHFIGRM